MLDARHVLFDDDTQFMFASVFDGSWDTYIDDFGKTVVGANFDRIFSHTEGFPGVSDPGVKEWFVAHQEPAGVFVSSYPDLTVQQIAAHRPGLRSQEVQRQGRVPQPAAPAHHRQRQGRPAQRLPQGV
ncbi:hypothetical protein ACIHCV_33925 [Streptomyces sp. NPDC051956]|uniref:hypothetical protein n=1 Tax=Streptomyces sp. NPDC051956 TaxID=3365677 RepID=UPI0037D74913